MPRKPTPPQPILFVQSLSTGRLITPRFVEDDLNPGELIPTAQDMRPVRELPSGNELLTAAKQVKINKQMDMLKALGIVEDDRPKPPPEPIVPKIDGMRPITKLGDKLMIYIEANPIRRGN